jgi:sugar O-acyltransferase (sialic acid O-acetyltransferase NeuD family)
MARIGIVGGGGFAKEVIEVARLCGHEIAGIFALENSLDEFPHLGYLDEMLQKREAYDALHLAIGAVNRQSVENRRKLLDFIRQHGLPMISLVSPKADIGEGVQIGEGVYIAHRALISCNATLLDAVLVNHGAVIGHDCLVEENVSLAPLVFLGGNVHVERDCMLGARSTIRQGLKIGERSLVGMGSLVIKNLKPESTTLQMPSKIYGGDRG